MLSDRRWLTLAVSCHWTHQTDRSWVGPICEANLVEFWKKTAPDVSLHSTIWEITVGERERAGTWKIKVKSTWRAIGRAVCISESNNQSGQLIKKEEACLPSWNECTSSDVTDAVERLCWLLHVFCRSSRLNHSCSCWLFLTGQRLAWTPLVQTQQLA